MLEMRIKALAKVNLGLDVLRKREDGYHEVQMVMQTIHLYDRIQLRGIEDFRTKDFANGDAIKVTTNLFYLPSNENNLVYKAAKLLKEEFHIPGGICINLKKFIPVSAGLAGGSSDAAAVLFGLNRMYHLGLSLQELMARGVKLGADVPYCLMRGTALAEGIGEDLTPLKPVPKCPILLAKPAINVSTKYVYENLKLDSDTVHPDMDALLSAISRQDLKQISANMGNVLESVTIPRYPVIAQIKEEMKRMGALNAMMSGSGPTVFGIFESEQKVKAAYKELKKSNLAKQLYVTGIYQNRSKVKKHDR